MAERGSSSAEDAAAGARTAADAVERFGSALIQHGKSNDRVYIMDPGTEPAETLIARADELAAAGGYTKLFAKVPGRSAAAFFAAGWRLEAFVPGLFGGHASSRTAGAESQDGFFIVKYLQKAREAMAGEPAHRKKMADFARMLSEISPAMPKPLPRTMTIRECLPEDAERMAAVFAQVFSDYPFPVDDPAFIRESMKEGTDYLCAESDGRIAALSSAEINVAQAYAEMTDFAVLPEYRGLGLAGTLLQRMETAAASKGIETAYTIARLNAPGMNAAFLKADYRYGGTLFANTAMPEGLESMNVLYKGL